MPKRVKMQERANTQPAAPARHPSRNKQNHSLPETMTINGQDCSNTQVIAEHFNTFFATIGAQNNAYIRTHQGSHFRDYLTRPIVRFEFHEIHTYETI